MSIFVSYFNDTVMLMNAPDPAKPSIIVSKKIVVVVVVIIVVVVVIVV